MLLQIHYINTKSLKGPLHTHLNKSTLAMEKYPDKIYQEALCMLAGK